MFTAQGAHAVVAIVLNLPAAHWSHDTDPALDVETYAHPGTAVHETARALAFAPVTTMASHTPGTAVVA